jgi:uncharacterized protein (DUF3084 family)
MVACGCVWLRAICVVCFGTESEKEQLEQDKEAARQQNAHTAASLTATSRELDQLRAFKAKALLDDAQYQQSHQSLSRMYCIRLGSASCMWCSLRYC